MERLIGVIGLNYTSAPVEIRGMMSFSEEQAATFVRLLKSREPVAGAVVLSTCNRTEIYVHVKNLDAASVFDLVFGELVEFKKLDESIAAHLYYLQGLEAVTHLFRVASGLNSMILGEDQIIGQVKNAFLISDHVHGAGPVLTRLFNRSFQAGKRVRTETHINEGSASVSSAAATLARMKFPDIAARSILLVGAGQTGRLSAMSLTEKGCRNLYITNRTYEKAEEVAREFGVTAVPFDRKMDYLAVCDVVMVATGSAVPLIEANDILRIMPLRDHRPMVILDLSVPRNVESTVGGIENITLYDVDDTETVIRDTLEMRRSETMRAGEIVDEMAAEFMEWLASLNLSPTIRQIQESFRRVHETEYANYRKFRDGLESRPFREYGNHISEKFTRLIIENLKQVTDNGKKVEYLKMLNELFELRVTNEK